MHIIKENDVVLGYTLRARIGSGGFGEVWSAEAPGGILKAVKFIYGYHDDDRALNELKSLDRIKRVRHPFLLSLERIQVVSGQLVIITELGDKSLAELFRETNGPQGRAIAREELLQYMRDAAEALDYISCVHNLQHLDIKPENLLLVGGHIKIADFGLVKEIQATAQSMLSGLTPVYAPPELFDGRPHRNSDQYSLAIVYQEMLTGTRPFDGQSPAQLASQHLHCRPTLHALPPRDQVIIARALSKDPNLRYPSCREMVDELSERKPRPTVKAAPVETTSASAPQVPANEDPLSGSTSTMTLFQMPQQESLSTSLPALDLSAMPAQIGPTLIIGLGRSACGAVERVRQKMIQHFGPASEMPAVAVLCLDTDAASLFKFTQTGSTPGLSEAEILPVPLRTPEQYRQANKRWSWLSRRWIYNIPRSGQTEGLRPLGRLAFADHVNTITRRIKEIASDIINPEVVAKTADTVGLDPRTDRVNVFLVTTSSGGIGSGMSIDLACAVRSIFLERGIDDVQVTGILAHAVPRGANEQLLAISNTLSLLSEMRHFNRTGYPGDETCGLPRIEGYPVFDDTYIVTMGDNLSATAHVDAFRTLGDYLFLNVATRCQTFMEQCRRQSPSEFRSVGLRLFGLGQANAFQEMSRRLAEALVARWVDEGQAAARLANEPAVEAPAVARQWAPDQVLNRVRLSAEPFAAAASQAWQSLASTIRGSLGTPQAIDRLEQADQQLAEMFDGVPSGDARANDQGWRQEIESQAYPIGLELDEAAWTLMDDPRYRLAGAKLQVVAWIRAIDGLIDNLKDDAARQSTAQQESWNQLKLLATSHRKASASQDSFDVVWAELFAARRQRFECAMSIAFLSRIQNAARETEYSIQQLQGQIARWVAETASGGTSVTDTVRMTTSFPIRQSLDRVEQLLPSWAEQVDTHLHHGWLHEAGGLAKVLRDPSSFAQRLPARLRAVCNTIMTNAQRELSLSDLVQDAQISPAALSQWLQSQIQAAKPHLATGSGALRLMIAHSGNEETHKILGEEIRQAEVPATLLAYSPGDLVICQELQDIPFTQLVHRLMDGRTDSLDFIARLHTRTDVDWSSLHSQCQTV